MTIERLADFLANTNPGFFILVAALIAAVRAGCCLARHPDGGRAAGGAGRADLGARG